VTTFVTKNRENRHVDQLNLVRSDLSALGGRKEPSGFAYTPLRAAHKLSPPAIFNSPALALSRTNTKGLYFLCEIVARVYAAGIGLRQPRIGEPTQTRTGEKWGMTEQVIQCTEADVRTALLTKGGENAKRVAKNPKLLREVIGALKGVAERDASATLASGLSIADQQTSSSSASKNAKTAVKTTSFVVSQSQLTWSMNAVTKLTPGRALAFVVSVFTQFDGVVFTLSDGY